MAATLPYEGKDDNNEDNKEELKPVMGDCFMPQRMEQIFSNDREETATHENDVSPRNQKNISFFQYVLADLTRGYLLENDGSRYAERREKVYTFMKMPREVEKFMTYGFFQCADAFLFVFTFLPLRFLLAFWFLTKRIAHNILRKNPKNHRILQPAEICDLLKGITIIVCGFLMTYIDTAMMYHLIKSQSVIKLYIFFNMLEVADRLFSSFGQDLLDTLFWTATEPRERKREHFGVLPHLTMAVLYVFLHSMLVLCQATTLNVAINASNKALLTIMMSNNFVELKGSVFKKFEKNNLFQMSCCDVRERFHYVILLVTVVVQTMKEYAWKEERFWILFPDCLMVLGSEFLVDWVKHAFITRFNEIPLEVYKDYTVSLAYDIATSKHRHAFSDHSDLVSRRMGFIPLPLGILMFRIVSQSVKFHGPVAYIILVIGYFCLIACKVLTSIVLLGIACDLIEHHRHNKMSQTQLQSKIFVHRAKSHPSSRKASMDRLAMGGLSHSSTLLHPIHLLGSLGNIPAEMEDHHSLGPKPIYCNSTVSLNSLGVSELPSPDSNISPTEIFNCDSVFKRPNAKSNNVCATETPSSEPDDRTAITPIDGVEENVKMNEQSARDKSPLLRHREISQVNISETITDSNIVKDPP